jgi:hypothetical protein
MAWLFEQELIIVVVGVLLLLGLGIAWSSTGRNELAYAAGLVLLLVVAGVILERLVVTDRESLEATLQEIARDVAANNHRALYKHLADTAPELRQRAEQELPNYKFQTCRVSKIHNLHVDSGAAPKSAEVEFNVVFSGDFHYEGVSVNSYSGARWIKLHFIQDQDGRWKVEDYEHDDPQRMIMERQATP